MTHDDLTYAEIAALCAQLLTEDERSALDQAAMAEAMTALHRERRARGSTTLAPPVAAAITAAARGGVLPLRRKPSLAR